MCLALFKAPGVEQQTKHTQALPSGSLRWGWEDAVMSWRDLDGCNSHPITSPRAGTLPGPNLSEGHPAVFQARVIGPVCGREREVPRWDPVCAQVPSLRRLSLRRQVVAWLQDLEAWVGIWALPCINGVTSGKLFDLPGPVALSIKTR